SLDITTSSIHKDISFFQSLRPDDSWRIAVGILEMIPRVLLRLGDEGFGWLGTLKLADLGRARQHMDRTSDRNKTAEHFSTLPYDPPDVFTNISRGRSRLV